MGKSWTIKDIEALQGRGYVATSVPHPGLRQTVKYAIGIDPGVNTGIAIWDRPGKVFQHVGSTKIHAAMQLVLQWQLLAGNAGILVRLEDARQHIWFGEGAKARIQGAGSVKRDCGIWQDFLDEKAIPYELVPPKKNKTKVTAEYFRRASGWQRQTNNHARDAGMLVLNY